MVHREYRVSSRSPSEPQDSELPAGEVPPGESHLPEGGDADAAGKHPHSGPPAVGRRERPDGERWPPAPAPPGAAARSRRLSPTTAELLLEVERAEGRIRSRDCHHTAPRFSDRRRHRRRFASQAREPAAHRLLQGPGRIQQAAGAGGGGAAPGVIAASTGNHGAAVAFAARELGVSARVIVPSNADAGKVAAIAALGGEVVTTEKIPPSRKPMPGSWRSRKAGRSFPPTTTWRWPRGRAPSGSSSPGSLRTSTRSSSPWAAGAARRRRGMDQVGAPRRGDHRMLTGKLGRDDRVAPGGEILTPTPGPRSPTAPPAGWSPAR